MLTTYADAPIIVVAPKSASCASRAHAEGTRRFFSPTFEPIGNKYPGVLRIKAREQRQAEAKNSLEVRSERGYGKMLFSWIPSDDIIDIVVKGCFYRVKLMKQGDQGAYIILEKHPKN